MSLKIAIQMDEPDTLSVEGDSTIIIGVEACKRGHYLFYYHPSSLHYKNGDIYAHISEIAMQDPLTNQDWYEKGEQRQLKLNMMDAVLLRQDPPFDMHYITTTHLLEQIHPSTLVVNDPFHVRNAPEKIFPVLFKDYMPETLIGFSKDAIYDFLEQYKDIVVKPLYGHGGMGIFRLRENGDNTDSIIESICSKREALTAQRFLPEVSDGDRRIIMIDGKVEGVLGRIPKEGEIRANFRVGGTAAEAELTSKQKQICEAVGQELKKRGLIFVGLDLIGDWLTEINVTSPTGLRGVKDLYGTKPESLILDAIERYVK